MPGDLISREAARLVIRNVKETAELFSNDDYRVGYISALSLVEGLLADAPAIDAVPVVHGRWEYHKGASVGGNDVWTCSECYRGYNWVDGFDYCPNCGAKIDKEDGHALD